MAVNSASSRASTDEVWAVLADGWRYTNWVVGASHMRAVHAEWPEPGTKLFHASGIWPLLTRDQTTVESVDPGRSIVLTARGRPLGEARIELTLEPAGAGCTITMRESPVTG